MQKLQAFLRLLCVWALLLVPGIASAQSPVHRETHVRDFEVAAEACVRLSALANSSEHQEKLDASMAEAVGYPHATKGAGSAAQSWKLGAFKSAAKWEGQLAKRGWTPQQISEAIQKGEQVAAENLVNKGNAAIRYVHPQTGQSVVVDQITKEVIHVGGPGFKY